MRFLVFQHIACEHPAIFRQFMAEDEIEWDAIELDEGGIIPSTDSYDALLVMGGPMDVWQKDQHPWLVDELKAIRQWVSEGRPYLGFCLGHQLLAEAMGGKVGPSRQPEIGILPVALTEPAKSHWFFRNCPEEMDALQWHSAEVIELPPNGVALAQSDACAVNAMTVGNNAVSVQFHVEIMEHTVAEWGQVPEYAAALEGALGVGAMEKMENDAASGMVEFNRLSRILYRNFVDRLGSVSVER